MQTLKKQTQVKPFNLNYKLHQASNETYLINILYNIYLFKNYFMFDEKHL